MDTPAATASISRRILKWLLWLFGACLIIITLLGVAVYMLPGLVSSDWFRHRFERHLSQTFQRTLSLEQLQWSWSDGIRLKELSITDDAAFSDRKLVRLKRASFTLDLKKLFQRRLIFDLELEGLDIRLIRNPDGRTNLEGFLSGIKPRKKVKPKAAPINDLGTLPLAFLRDIEGRINIDKTSLYAEDRETGRVLKVHDVSVLMEAPSLTSAPITLNASMSEQLNGRPLPSAHLSAQIKNLISPEGFLTLSETELEIEGRLPGALFSVQGGLKEKGLEGKVELELARLGMSLQPFLGPVMPSMSGSIELSLHVSGGVGEQIAFTTKMAGRDIALSGGLLKNNRLEPIRFVALHEGTIDLLEGILDIRNGEVRVEDHSRINWKGTVNRLKGPGPVGDLTIDSLFLDLKELHPFIKGFEPPGVSLPDLAGSVEMYAEISGNPLESIAFVTRVTGTDLVASGRVLNDAQLGPFHFSAVNEGTVNLEKEALEIREWAMQARDYGSLSLHGTVSRVKSSSPVSNLIIGPLSLNLSKTYSLVKRFMPSGLAFFPTGLEGGKMFEAGATPGVSSSLHIKKIGIRGAIPLGPTRMELEGLSLTLPRFRLNTAGGLFTWEDLDLKVQRGAVLLESLFPVRAEVSAGLRIRNVHLKASEEIRLEQIDLPSFDLLATDMALSPDAIFGISGKISMDESAVIKRIRGPKKVRVPELRQSLKVQLLLDPDPLATVDIKRFEVAAPSLSIEDAFKERIETGLDFQSGVTGLKLRGLSPLQADVEKLRADLDLEGLFRAGFDARALDLGSERLETRGDLFVNVRNLVTLLPSGTMPPGSVDGTIAMHYDFKGRLPRKAEMSLLAKGEGPLIERLRKIEFLEKLEIKTLLNNLGGDLDLGHNASLKVSRIGSSSPLILSLKNGVKEGSLKGEVLFGRVVELPLLGRLDQPMRITLSFSGAHEDFRSLRLSDRMHVEPLNLNQSVEISLHKIDKLLADGLGSPLEVLLQKVEGSAHGKIWADFKDDLSVYIEGLNLKGYLEAGAEILLTGGRDVLINSWLESPGLDVGIGEKLQITRLRSHIKLEKRYHTTPLAETDSVKKPAPTPLSLEVLNPQVDAQPAGEAGNIALRRLMDDLWGRLSPQRSLSMDSAIINVGPVPLEISNQEIAFRFLEDLPHIDYFQMDLLGGTSVGSLSLVKKEKGFVLEVNCSLSGLNANRLLPDIMSDVPDEEADISGGFSLKLPLSPDPRQVLNDLSLNAELTRIGAGALERFLYAMDPSESNEIIVRQRNLLRKGTPRWIKVKIGNGNLSMSGEVEAKGVKLDLPRIERFNVATLPVHQGMESGLSRLGDIIDLLKKISADKITIDPEGKIRLESSKPR